MTAPERRATLEDLKRRVPAIWWDYWSMQSLLTVEGVRPLPLARRDWPLWPVRPPLPLEV